MTTFPDGNVYVSKLKYGQQDSDSVKRLQVRLNEVEPKEGVALSLTGNYDAPTDKAVIAWQKHIGDSPDPVGKSYLGPKQANLIFAGSGNTVIDDSKNPVDGAGTALGKYIKSKGHKVNDSNVPYGRDSAWTGVVYILVHHTASSDTGSEQQIADFVKTGGQYPPLSQIMLGQSGTVWITTKPRAGDAEPGRATHAGKGSWPGVPKDRMNEYSLGIECQAKGDKPLSAYPTMYKALIKLIADLCKRYDVPVKNVIGHKEWSSTGKIDPRDSMDKIRADVKKALAPVEPPKPPVVVVPPIVVVPPVDPDDDDDPNFEYHYTGKPKTPQVVATRFKPVTHARWTPPEEGLLISMLYLNATCVFKRGEETGTIRVRAVRENPIDETGYQDFTITRADTKADPNADPESLPERTVEFLITHTWFEACDANRPIHWEVDRSAHFESVVLGTRYSKWALLPE